jgi:DNA-binding transcriptional LysR family regulator
MIDTKQLQYFVAVAETLHFGRAALRMHISQPPLSRQIAALERELGVQLFERNTRTVVLTKAGERLHADALNLLAGLRRAEDSAVATARGESGLLSIGFNMYAAYSVLPALASACLSEHPDIRVRLREYFSAPLIQALASDEVDLGIMLPPPGDSGFTTLTLLREPLVAALPRTHRLAGAKRINLVSLAKDPFIFTPREAAPALHDTIMVYCQSHGFTPSVRLEIFLQQTVIAMVAEGLGVALVPRSLQKTRLANVAFVALVEPPSIELVLAWNEQTRNPCVRSLIDLADPRRPLAGKTPASRRRAARGPAR